MTKNRSEYWNKMYLNYWKARVAEAENGLVTSNIVSGDKPTESDDIYFQIFEKFPLVGTSVLDVGCGWGRFFSYLNDKNLRISGIDISSAMIEMAKENLSADMKLDFLEVGEAENLPFDDETFDNLICLAVFDATFQNLAFMEFMRVLKPGGRLYVTGKNFDYFPNDQLAIDAEQGAKNKGHPNFFTKISDLLRIFEDSKHKVLKQYFFSRRGDFAEFNYHSKIDQKFYEYLVVLEKRNSKKFFLSEQIYSDESLPTILRK